MIAAAKTRRHGVVECQRATGALIGVRDPSPSNATPAQTAAGRPELIASQSRAAERVAHAGTGRELAVETLHEERHVVIAQRPARGDDDARPGGKEGAREAQRALRRRGARHPPTRTPTTRRDCR